MYTQNYILLQPNIKSWLWKLDVNEFEFFQKINSNFCSEGNKEKLFIEKLLQRLGVLIYYFKRIKILMSPCMYKTFSFMMVEFLSFHTEKLYRISRYTLELGYLSFMMTGWWGKAMNFLVEALIKGGETVIYG